MFREKSLGLYPSAGHGILQFSCSVAKLPSLLNHGDPSLLYRLAASFWGPCEVLFAFHLWFPIRASGGLSAAYPQALEAYAVLSVRDWCQATLTSLAIGSWQPMPCTEWNLRSFPQPCLLPGLGSAPVEFSESLRGQESMWLMKTWICEAVLGISSCHDNPCDALIYAGYNWSCLQGKYCTDSSM